MALAGGSKESAHSADVKNHAQKQVFIVYQ
jgi:hypothetical protein